jgi:hypothetical protein
MSALMSIEDSQQQQQQQLQGAEESKHLLHSPSGSRVDITDRMRKSNPNSSVI